MHINFAIWRMAHSYVDAVWAFCWMKKGSVYTLTKEVLRNMTVLE